MGDSSDEGEFQTFILSQNPAEPSQQTRGITHMKKLIKKWSDGIKEATGYNQWGQALGYESNHLASMVGSLARMTIPIDIDNWGQVPDNKSTLSYF